MSCAGRAGGGNFTACCDIPCSTVQSGQKNKVMHKQGVESICYLMLRHPL